MSDQDKIKEMRQAIADNIEDEEYCLELEGKVAYLLEKEESRVKKKFMADLVDEFKAFVLDALGEGIDEDFADHHDFLKASLRAWQEGQEEE